MIIAFYHKAKKPIHFDVNGIWIQNLTFDENRFLLVELTETH